MARRNLIAAVLLGALMLGAGALLPATGVRPEPAVAAETIAGPPDVAAAQRGLDFLAKVKENADPRFYPKAEGAFREALDANPENFEATYGMATLAAGRHDFHGGLRWGRKAIALNPYNSDARGVVGDSLLELGRYRAAGRAFQAMVDLKPGLPAFARISYLRELQGDIPGAIAAMEQALDSAGSPDDAAFAAFHVGELHLNEGRIDRAKAWYVRGTKIAPDSSTPIAGLAKIAALNGDLEGAIAMIQQLLEVNEEPGNAYFLGDLHTAAGDEAATAEAYDLATGLDAREIANGSNVKLEASLFAADHGRPVEALRLAGEEYRSRKSVHVADGYAWALYVNGRFEQAQRLSKEALRIGSRSALFEFHAGMIAFALDQRVLAVRHLRTALDLNPIFSLEHRATAERMLDCLTDDCGRNHR